MRPCRSMSALRRMRPSPIPALTVRKMPHHMASTSAASNSIPRSFASFSSARSSVLRYLRCRRVSLRNRQRCIARATGSTIRTSIFPKRNDLHVMIFIESCYVRRRCNMTIARRPVIEHRER